VLKGNPRFPPSSKKVFVRPFELENGLYGIRSLSIVTVDHSGKTVFYEWDFTQLPWQDITDANVSEYLKNCKEKCIIHS
jgi:hypothetical protein